MLKISGLSHIKKAIERFKANENQALLQSANVVGATCNATTFDILKDMEFPVVVLDECSQITEPMSLLPILRFQCRLLVDFAGNCV